MSSVGNAVGGGVVYVAKLPGKAVGAITNVPGVESFIRPAEFAEVPFIDPDSPELAAALEALPPAQKTGQPDAVNKIAPQWPLHGRVTAEFGIPHWPYQPVHTGIDISDGTVPGTTPIKPFRPGKVIDTVYSYYGYGNHVIVDHGNGVTSVYAHFDSISVKVGQEVNLNTTLGLEGTTGLSTGTHLHFEIRVNGQVTNPRQFISGNP